MLEKGLVQIYTGNGKGKTTAAFGLALRAAGHGARVLVYQFLKPPDLELGERNSFSKVEGISVKVLDQPWDMLQSLEDPDVICQVREKIKTALMEIDTAAHENYFDLIIMDEIIYCLSTKLADIKDIQSVLDNRSERVEIVMTGRGATSELIDMADLVTEMKQIKHPFDKGIKARKGIEF